MKIILKNMLTGTVRLARTLYYTRINRRIVKKKYLKPTDSISKSYKKDIERYWGNYGVKVCTDWHKLYTSRNGIEDVRYIPEDLYYSKIEPALNNQRFSLPYEDKSLFDLLMTDFKKAVTVVRNVNGSFLNSVYELISFRQAIGACIGIGEIVIKPTIYSGGGREVLFINPGEGEEAFEHIKDIFLKYKSDFIVQEPIIQHEEFHKMNSDSVNTMKFVSLLMDDVVSIVSAHIRVGLKGNRVDNLTNGGYSVGVDENGILLEVGVKSNGEEVTFLPNGYTFKGKKLPGYKKAVELIKKAHLKLGHFRLVSWDIAIGADETPVFIEYNLFFQGITLHQLNNGPLFGDKTEKVLEFVFNKDKLEQR